MTPTRCEAAALSSVVSHTYVPRPYPSDFAAPGSVCCDAGMNEASLRVIDSAASHHAPTPVAEHHDQRSSEHDGAYSMLSSNAPRQKRPRGDHVPMRVHVHVHESRNGVGRQSSLAERPFTIRAFGIRVAVLSRR